MGRRGPAPQSAATRKLRGNPGKRKIAEEVKLPAGTPGPPPWLGKLAREIWSYTVDSLKGSVVLALADRGALAAYCDAEAKAARLSEKCDKLKLDDESDNKLMRLCVTWARAAADFRVQLYLTPAARARLKAPDGPKDDDPLAALLRAKAARKQA